MSIYYSLLSFGGFGGGEGWLISAPRNNRYADKYSLQQMLDEVGGGDRTEEGIVYVPF